MVNHSQADTFFAEHESRLNEELFEFLKIPSVSTDPSHSGDIRSAAVWVKNRLRGAGFPYVELIETELHPVVFGRWHADPVKPTILLYGHYDVQPPEPLELWTSPPFEPTVRDGRIYARGAADMKTNLVTLIQAIEATGKSNGSLPVNLLVLFEGEEEMGSPHLPTIVRDRKDQLRADVILSADGGMMGADTPSLVTSFKGLAACQVTVETGRSDLHSGSYGAAVPNAVQSLVQMLATLHNTDNSVAIKGFYNDVRPLSEDDRRLLAETPFDESTFLAESGAHALWGESDYSVLERRWKRPALDINGIWGGFSGDGVKTVTPSLAHAKLTCRLVPDQDPHTILDFVEKHFEKQRLPGTRVTIDRHDGTAAPFVLGDHNRGLAIARESLNAVFGLEALLVGSGGTVPITEVFQTELEEGTVSIGFAMPASGAHAPNEWFRIEDLDKARRTYTQFLLRAGS